MSKKQDRTVFKNDEGKWANQRNDADRASTLHNTQQEAAKEARRLLQQQGGGELTIKGLDGKIRSKDTIPPGHDPLPPRDKEH